MKTWESSGYRFGDIKYVDNCVMKKSGVIQIKGDSNLNVKKYYAWTDTYANNNIIYYADIKVDRYESHNKEGDKMEALFKSCTTLKKEPWFDNLASVLLLENLVYF